jgi:predicted ATPase
MAWALWMLGYPDRALKQSQKALALAQQLAHPFTLAIALDRAAWLHQFRREAQAAQTLAEVLITLSTEQEFALSWAHGTILRGRALAEQGHSGEDIAQVRQGLVALQATGAKVFWPCWLALLAETYGKRGQAEEGLTVLSDALATVDKNGERLWEAELYRLKGELTLQQSGVQSLESRVREAEGCFLKAIEIARKQQAKSLELRAVMSLARLRQSQGKKAEAHTLLSEIYDWFTEGFDTQDLQEAKVLLEQLTSDSALS